ncbi:MAG: type IV pili twitching motility protein PilT, partial [Gallionella sp.]
KNDEIEKIRDAIEKSVSAGSQTFEQALYKLHKAGKISKDEAMRNADSASNLSTLIDFSSGAKTAQNPAFKTSVAASSLDEFKLNLDVSK